MLQGSNRGCGFSPYSVQALTRAQHREDSCAVGRGRAPSTLVPLCVNLPALSFLSLVVRARRIALALSPQSQSTVTSDSFMRIMRIGLEVEMDVQFTVSAIITVSGLLIAALSLAHALAQSRGKRFFERSVQLLDLRERLHLLGPFHGATASSSAALSHGQLLDAYEREARVHATLYLAAVSRLEKPGSYVGGFFLLTYALITATITGSTVAEVLQAGPVAVALVGGLPGLATLLLSVAGARLVVRRERTSHIKAQIGEVDPLSVEGWHRTIDHLISFMRSARRWSGKRRPTPPAQPTPEPALLP